MAANEFALLWSRQVRGLTIAEKAVLGVLASFHDRTTGRCRVQLGHLVWRFESSRIYLRQVVHSLEKKGFISIEANFDARNLQESNSFKLHTDRWFPRDSGWETGMRLLRSHIRSITQDNRMSGGFVEAWVKPMKKRRSTHAKLKLFVAVQSPDHLALLLDQQFALIRTLAKIPPHVSYEIIPVKTFLDSRKLD